jgi:peptide/nickel transport system permease protein
LSAQTALGQTTSAPGTARAGWFEGRRITVGLAATWLVVVSVLAFLAPVLPLARYDIAVDVPKLPPGLRWPEFLGTDELGRSMLSRIVYGARASLTVGVLAVSISLAFGGFFGLLAGYFRRGVDTVISFGANVGLAFPSLLLLMALAAVLEPSMTTLVISLGLVLTPSMIRIARASTLAVAKRDYVKAAESLGARPHQLILQEIVPNIVAPLSTVAFVYMATVIVAEGSLSFLGLGLTPPTPSWGGMIASGRRNFSTDPYLVFLPAAMLVLTVIAIQVVGDWARKRYERRESQLGSN